MLERPQSLYGISIGHIPLLLVFFLFQNRVGQKFEHTILNRRQVFALFKVFFCIKLLFKVAKVPLYPKKGEICLIIIEVEVVEGMYINMNKVFQ